MVNSKFEIRNSTLKNRKTKIINLPMSERDALSLHIGDMVLINGLIVTGRDKIHRFLFHKKLSKVKMPFNLEGLIIYHCGPIVKKTEEGFKIIAGGPTTSMRVEAYEHFIISRYRLRGVMGKGGMGKQTMRSLRKNCCVYLQTIGGAAVFLAERIKRVAGVWKLKEFGSTEAMWAFEVECFPAVVTMDAHGRSLHKEIEKRSLKRLT